ncbi:hypothetical protein [Kitasatospora sp. McL0602]|uniref:hypothetical protein n=1 Tax=Kitasatospora sp. McL0602 TaxID=3439530 RepID=UPI003F8C6EE8
MSPVEFYPRGLFGLHWEAAGDDPEGLLLARVDRERVAVASARQPDAVLVMTSADLGVLRTALVGSEFKHLLPDDRASVRCASEECRTAPLGQPEAGRPRSVQGAASGRSLRLVRSYRASVAAWVVLLATWLGWLVVRR